MFLEQAAWIDKNGNENPITGPGILLTKDVGIEYVLFLDPAYESNPPNSLEMSPEEHPHTEEVQQFFEEA
jgi:hypothetical protein